MKIFALELETDLGRRVVQLSPPIDVDPFGDIPPHFRSLIEVFWNCLHQAAVEGPAIARSIPKAEA